jgi:hypothetical protein
MTLTTLLNRPMTIINRSASASTDEFGNELPVETYVDVVGELQQQRRAEPDTAGELSDTRWLLILPAGTEINTGDTVVCDGESYEVTGDPWRARNPRTQLASHIECTLRRTAGADDTVTTS